MTNSLRRETPSNTPLILSSLLVLVCLVGALITSYLQNPPVPTYDAYISWVGYTEDDVLAGSVVNGDQLADEGAIPLMVVNNGAEADALVTTLTNAGLTADGRYNDSTPLQTVLKKFDDDFYSESALLVVYLTESSGSIRHRVGSITAEDGRLAVSIVASSPSNPITDDMAGWLIVIPYAKVNLEGVTSYEALRVAE